MIKWLYDGGFLTAQQAVQYGATKAQLAQAVKVTSFEVERDVKTRMPIDTGRARGSWGHPTSPAVRAGDSVWLESDGGLTIEQGSNVEYIPRLNEGYSKQAAAGFLDAIAAAALGKLERNAERAIGI